MRTRRLNKKLEKARKNERWKTIKEIKEGIEKNFFDEIKISNNVVFKIISIKDWEHFWEQLRMLKKGDEKE